MGTLFAGLLLIVALFIAGVSTGLVIIVGMVVAALVALELFASLISWPVIVAAGLIYYFCFYKKKKQRY